MRNLKKLLRCTIYEHLTNCCWLKLLEVKNILKNRDGGSTKRKFQIFRFFSFDLGIKRTYPENYSFLAQLEGCEHLCHCSYLPTYIPRIIRFGCILISASVVGRKLFFT